MGSSVDFHQLIRAARNSLRWRDRALLAQDVIKVFGFALRACSGQQFEAGDHRNRPLGSQAIQIVRRCRITSGDVHKDIRVNQISHQIAVFNSADAG